MSRVRAEVTILVEDRKFLESCDEGAAQRFARVEQAGLHRTDRKGKVPSLHLSWRQPHNIIELNEDEVRLLKMAGYDVKLGEEYPYVMVLEKKFRHRFLAYNRGGWCISSADRGENLSELSPSEHTIIPTLDLPPEAPMIIGVHDVFRTLKEDLKKHGIFTEFFVHLERVFQILAVLVEDARRDLGRATDSVHAVSEEAPMGRVTVATG